MAVRFSADGQDYSRVASLGTLTAFSVACWVKISTDRNAISTVWSVDDFSTGDYLALQTGSDGTTLGVVDDAGFGSYVTRALTVGTWYYVGVTVTGGTGTMVTRALGDSTFTASTWSSGSADVVGTGFTLGESAFTGEWLNGCLAAVKLWSGSSLTQAELEAEAWTVTPRRTANLRAWYPFDRASTVDYSGNGRTLSGGSGTTTEDGPGIAWGMPSRALILPGGVAATVTATAVAAVVAVPVPVVATGAGTAPSSVAVVAAVPAAAVSVGQSVLATAVAAVATVPAATVTTGSISVVTPGTVAVVAAVPAAAVSAGQSVLATAVAAVATVSAPAITSGASITAAPVVVLARVPLPTISVPILPGDRIEEDGQVEYDGALWGTPQIRVQEIAGWESLPSIDNGNVLRPNRHGAWAGRKTAQQRLVTIKLRLNSADDPTQVQNLVRELRAATRIFDDNSETDLVIRTYGEQLLARGTVIDRDIVLDSDWSVGQPAVSLLIACADPRRYDPMVISSVITNGASSTVINAGDTASHPIVRINGPATQPSLSNLTTEKLLAFNITLLSNERLEIDTNAGEVTLNGADRMSALSALSVPVEEWYLTSGSNVISYSASSGGSGGAEIQWRSAFL